MRHARGRRSSSEAARGARVERGVPRNAISINCQPPTPTRHRSVHWAMPCEALAQLDRRRACVVELRFFGGLSVEGTADVLQVSPQTVMRDWRLARAWLGRELRREGQEKAGL